MTRLAVEKFDLPTCIRRAQDESVVVTQKGIPVALVVGIEGLDQEQVQLGASDKFWKLIRDRRKDKALSRTELEESFQRKSQTIKSRRKLPRK